MRAKLGLLAATATALVLATTSYVTGRSLHRQLEELVIEAGSTESDSLRTVLEEEMKAGDRKLLNRLVVELGSEPNIVWVGVLDFMGKVRISSDPAAVEQVVPQSSPECAICHDRPPAERMRSVTVPRGSGHVLRTVAPLVNRQACHRCHDPNQHVNGMLIIDRSLTPLQSAVIASRNRVVGGSLAALFALLLTLGPAVEHLVLRRLRRLGEAARLLGQGDMTARAVDRTSDELGDLARDFNSMAERLSGAMTQLATERRQLEELLNGISDGVVLADADLQVLVINRALAARLPPEQHAGAGMPYRTLVQAAGLDDGATGRFPAERALLSGKLEKEIIRSEGSNRVDEIYAQPLHSVDGSVTAVIEVWRDISDRQALEAGLAQSERLAALGILASCVAHEVGNPLASIATAVEGLLSRLGRPEESDINELRDYLEIVLKQVFRCRDVTERLLGFARLPGQQTVVVDAVAAVREMVALISPQARAQSVELQCSLADEAKVIAEDLLLEQVVLNLALNALKAMGQGGVLRVELAAEGDEVRLTIADSGPGIPASILRDLFKPLRRSREQGIGTGLGLFITHNLVTRCQGTISVVNHPGKGATFTVKLRRAPQTVSSTVEGAIA